MDIVISKAGVPVRLTEERWFHIVESHDDLAGYYDQVLEAVEDPDFVCTGYAGTLMAGKQLGRRKYLMVIYKELTRRDGFIITAYFTSEVFRRRIRWRKGQPWRKR
jgi:hypothetical protein